jgi:alanyl aminopeptidase
VDELTGQMLFWQSHGVSEAESWPQRRFRPVGPFVAKFDELYRLHAVTTARYTPPHARDTENTMQRVTSIILVLCVFAACGGKQKTEPAPPPKPKPVQIDGHARLPETVTPKAYRLDLTIDPAKETFSGTAEIDVDVAEATHVIYMHGEEFEISEARFVRGEKTLKPEARLGDNGGLALVFAPDLEAGEGTIEIDYEAPLDEVPTGLYRVQDGENWYAFTQFEPLEARQAFPAFDEPRFKTPYTVTMRVPTGQLALTNTPEKSKETEGEMDVFTFTESKPLPTYLVAFAVGEFDVVEAPEDAIEGVPLRLIATKGKGKLGEYMLKRTPAILQYLSLYFGSDYPFQKLDIIAVPNFSAGAMENVGLVTFRERLLLLDSETASVGARRSAMSVMAHELAHMWFGNMVTLPWWDELWLNEAFATWMAHKTLVETVPQLGADIDAILSVNWVIKADSKTKSRQIRQPIEHGGDVYNAFDGITYGKGAAVLRMFEAWIGPEAMQKGIQAYLNKHAHATGTTEALLAALDEASGKPVGEAMSTFLDQPGAPLLDVSVDCESEKPKIDVTQSRYLPAGSQAEATGPWSVPFCVGYPEGREMGTYCDLLDAESKSFELPVDKCPRWVYPNAGQAGYYRWSVGEETLEDLTGRRAMRRYHEDATKVEILTNLEALSRAEKLPADAWFSAIEGFSREQHRNIVRQIVGTLSGVNRIITDENRKKFQRKARRLLRRHMRRVGYEPSKRESVGDALLRPALLRASARLADDSRAKRTADKTTKKFLDQMDSVRSDMAGASLPITAWEGDASLWLSYKLSVTNAPTPAARVAAIRGLGSFRDPELLEKSLALFLDGTLRAQDMWTLIGPSFGTDETFAVTWKWFTENFDAIVEKIGHKAVPRLPGVGSGFCSEEGKKKVEEFFADENRRKPGTERNLANTLESIDQCMRRRAYYAEGLDTLL